MSSLLVPMHLDAMVQNQELADATTFARALPNYANLAALEPVWTPFDASGDAPGVGVHLHWTLPRPLRHGTAPTGSTSPTWPYVPNRWVVVRIQDDAEPTLAVKAWIVASDALGDASTGSPSVDPRAAGAPVPAQIGSWMAFTDQVTALPASAPPFLTAVGPGSPEFSLYAPAARGVFGLHDDMTAADGTTPIATGTFTYHVSGWYADPSDDPLGRDWTASSDPDRLVHARFGFIVHAATAADVPSTMLLHSLVKGVSWDSTGRNVPAPDYPADIPSTVRVGFGDTALDAVAGIVRNARGNQTEADLLQTFGYGLLDHLDEPAAPQRLDIEIRRASYDSIGGGSAYTVIAADASADPVVLDQFQQQKLADLNAAQREQDRQARLLEAMRWRLKGLWWKRVWSSARPSKGPPIDPLRRLLNREPQCVEGIERQLALHTAPATSGKPPTYLDEVIAQAVFVSSGQDALDQAKDELADVLGSTMTLKELAQPGFHAPGDPVMVVTGLGRSSNLDPIDGLVCRVPSQLLSGAEPPPLTDPHSLLPADVQGLHREAYLISQESDVPEPAPVAAAQFPALADARTTWKQPWVPLILEWEVGLISEPAYTSGVDRKVFTWDPGNWTFDGTGYAWTASLDAEGNDFNPSSLTLSGRTFITPQVSFTLADQLDDWVAKHTLHDPTLQGDVSDLDQFLDSVRGQDVLSQRLTGMRALMIQRDEATTVAATEPVLSALGDANLGASPSPLRHDVARPVRSFAPLAGTFFTIRKLRVTDFMGRTIDLLLGNASPNPQTADAVDEEYFYPIAGRGLACASAHEPPQQNISISATERMLQLPPRLSQPARVQIRLTAADGSDREISCVAGGDPICGWVVPNHLDRSLALYSPTGDAWGELFVSAHADGQLTTRWEPDPIEPHPPASVDAIPNRHVSAWLQSLCGRRDSGDAFTDVLQTIDETLWNIDPRGARKDQALSVLVGRPLAIVRASVSLRIAGLPALSQDWWNTFGPVAASGLAPLAEVDGRVLDYLWPVRLGDPALRNDGLIGYFADSPSTITGGFAHMAAVHRPADRPAGYLIDASAPAAFPQLRFSDDRIAEDALDPEQSQVVRLTMLVDPRAGVHLFSGLLPVETVTLPPELYLPALRTMSFRFRVGPIMMPPGEVRLPRPSERKGTWTWFDGVSGESAVVADDGKPRLPIAPPVIREGWLKLKPTDAS